MPKLRGSTSPLLRGVNAFLEIFHSVLASFMRHIVQKLLINFDYSSLVKCKLNSHEFVITKYNISTFEFVVTLKLRGFGDEALQKKNDST